ncbi:unnamed protein product [Phytophthora fragariaefolia]|uniref:Unnamed protein product n=1 Tax=Phytophthora fragariaefolia TaxID=1490495 RepID=A0A9W6XUQ8_9STRA|nr:unnamed protein product [Phytophthora fragariaefolia]
MSPRNTASPAAATPAAVTPVATPATASFDLQLKAAEIRLVVLRKEEGGWATQDDADDVPGTEMRYPQQVEYVLPPLIANSDLVHLRVEPAPPRRRRRASKSGPTEDGNWSSLEGSNDHLNEPLNKKRKADESVPFSKCDQNTTDALLKFQKVSTYVQQEGGLPGSYVNAIDQDPHQREAARKAGLERLPARAPGALYTEAEIKAKGITGVGKADYVVKRGDKLVVVIEAKRTDVTQAKHQNLAAMEAVRCTNKAGKPVYSTIKGICTDFQTWVFLSRESGSICSDRVCVLPGNDSDFSVPGNLHTVVRKVYGMLQEVML